MATFLPAVLRGGVDIVQLREKDLGDDVRRGDAALMIAICRDFNVPFIMNDSPDLALSSGADGVHVGQEDVDVAHCRALLGPDALIGLSTHSRAEFDAALPENANYFSAGPIIETPTKPGRDGTGVDYAVTSARRSDRPVFVTGGVNVDNVRELVRAGVRHFVVVRALTLAADPESTARRLRDELDEALSTVAIEPT